MSTTERTHVSLHFCMALVYAYLVYACSCARTYRYFGLLRSNASKRSHPGAKPETCLCVTDIESSTSLWEELEATVVDIAVKLHNVCIRNLAAEHHG